MNYINSYFQLDIRDDGTYIVVYPPKENGIKLDINEVTAFIEKKKIYDYNVADLNKFIVNVNAVSSYKLVDYPINEYDESIVVKVSKDRMNAAIRLYPASTKGRAINSNDIVTDLKHEKIIYGISIKVIEMFLMNKQYLRDVIVVKGKAPTKGTNASIEYFFDINPTSKPLLLEDGTVDFHQLNIFSPVKEGDVLARLSKAVPGEEGYDVYGNKVLPFKVENKVLKYGRNIKISEDKTELTSMINGDVTLEGDTVFVSDTYKVSADVDSSTGDIDYEGNVVINGNVRTGFTVKAKGDIEVKGVVEGANLYAGGNIILKRGMQGMGKGVIVAEKDVVTKFVESGTVKTGGSLNTGSILHCTVEAKNKVIVSGKKGFIIGGDISATHSIETNYAGNKMGTVTILKVGIDPELFARSKELDEIVKSDTEQRTKCIQVLELYKKKMANGQKLLPSQVVQIKNTSALVKEVDERLKTNLVELNELLTKINENKDGCIKISDTIYPGVRITISNRNHFVKEERTHCQYKLDATTVTSEGLF